MKWQDFFTQGTISKIWNKIKSCFSFIFRGVKSLFSFFLKQICPTSISSVVTESVRQATYEGVAKSLLYCGLVKNSMDYPIACLGFTAIFLAAWFGIIFLSYIYIFKGITWLVKYIVEGFKTELAHFYQEPNTNIKTLSTNPSIDYINYHDAITKIKKSSYGIHVINDAINEGKIEETGGNTVTVKCGLGLLIQLERESYIPTSKEIVEQDKIHHIYDKILQEFCKVYGYYDRYHELKKDIYYATDSMKICLDFFDKFLREKEIEIQDSVALIPLVLEKKI